MDNKNQELSKNEIERRERERASKMRKVRMAFIWLLVLAAIVGGSFWLVSYSKKAQEKKPGEAIAEQGALHISPGTDRPDYNSNPPTSGPHFASPANWGAYGTPLPDEQVVHNLEHGGIWISYRDLENQDLIEELKNLVSKYSLKVILTPRPENDTKIAVAAWGRLLKLEEFDSRQITDFIKAFINKGPENVPF